MFDRTRETTAASPAIYLEYGADEAECAEEEVKLCGRGMCFKSRWRFPLNTQLAAVVRFCDGNGGSIRVTAEGVIVECEKIDDQCYRVVLVFVDLPQEIQQRLDQIAAQLPSAEDV